MKAKADLNLNWVLMSEGTFSNIYTYMFGLPDTFVGLIIMSPPSSDRETLILPWTSVCLSDSPCLSVRKSCLPHNLKTLFTKTFLRNLTKMFIALSNKNHNCVLPTFYTPPHNSGRVLWFHIGHPCVCPSVRPSVVRSSVCFSFPDDNLK